MSAAGWIGTVGQLMHVLATFGADRDEDGKFIVRGNISAFMGVWAENNDVVVAGNAEYRTGDKWCNLASALHATSYGKKVVVL